MRTSFHHQPEAQHPNFSLSVSWQADYPIFWEGIICPFRAFPLLMLWTAPTLRHQGAIGWLRRNAPLEGSRPWAKLARSVSISRSQFFKFTAWAPVARW